jgi:hypothetical protein
MAYFSSIDPSLQRQSDGARPQHDAGSSHWTMGCWLLGCIGSPAGFLRSDRNARFRRRPLLGSHGKMAMANLNSRGTRSRFDRAALGGLFHHAERSGYGIGNRYDRRGCLLDAVAIQRKSRTSSRRLRRPWHIFVCVEMTPNFLISTRVRAQVVRVLFACVLSMLLAPGQTVNRQDSSSTSAPSAQPNPGNDASATHSGASRKQSKTRWPT